MRSASRLPLHAVLHQALCECTILRILFIGIPAPVGPLRLVAQVEPSSRIASACVSFISCWFRPSDTTPSPG